MVTSKLKVRKASVITLFSITCNFLTRERGYKLYHLYACFHSFVKSQIFCLCSLILSSHWLCLRIILTLCITLLQAFSCKDFKDVPPVGSCFILQASMAPVGYSPWHPWPQLDTAPGIHGPSCPNISNLLHCDGDAKAWDKLYPGIPVQNTVQRITKISSLCDCSRAPRILL